MWRSTHLHVCGMLTLNIFADPHHISFIKPSERDQILRTYEDWLTITEKHPFAVLSLDHLWVHGRIIYLKQNTLNSEAKKAIMEQSNETATWAADPWLNWTNHWTKKKNPGKTDLEELNYSKLLNTHNTNSGNLTTAIKTWPHCELVWTENHNENPSQLKTILTCAQSSDLCNGGAFVDWKPLPNPTFQNIIICYIRDRRGPASATQKYSENCLSTIHYGISPWLPGMSCNNWSGLSVCPRRNGIETDHGSYTIDRLQQMVLWWPWWLSLIWSHETIVMIERMSETLIRGNDLRLPDDNWSNNHWTSWTWLNHDNYYSFQLNDRMTISWRSIELLLRDPWVHIVYLSSANMFIFRSMVQPCMVATWTGLWRVVT